MCFSFAGLVANVCICNVLVIAGYFIERQEMVFYYYILASGTVSVKMKMIQETHLIK